MRTISLDKIDNLTLDVKGSARDNLIRLLDSALSLTTALVEQSKVKNMQGGQYVNLAIASATQSVNALLLAASVMCHLDRPPENIEMKLTGAGKLVYRCYHDPAHEWDLMGNRIK